MIIVIEGIDGSGKTTQARLLFERIARAGCKVALLIEPTVGVYGKIIRDKIKSGNYSPMELYELFLRDRKLNARNIRKLLDLGYIVILDRYYISTIAYQGAQGIPISRILMDHSEFPIPDVVIILDVDPETALKRLKRKDTFENKEFLEQVRTIYLRMPEILRELKIEIRIINANRDPEIISEDMWNIVRNLIKCRDKE
ncbi:MAG: dTMP kinase [Crenarchaeota archaeon]|nr:dTMP kinase [Thermoproteota archaeon]MCR8453841.1 dTMP kinase [Thermoproteota archaeon]MCR8462610.1 dTMP kinase [Thermoproteota archaeon]MCR8472381.1 dTMP kinase [Thermoproteota archaeon]MCR8487404.1 dTMP kinase [Thermoproteota archaeon]